MSSKRLTKAQVIAEVAALSELDKQSVARALDGLTALIRTQLGSSGPGEFVIPGVLKLKSVTKKATEERTGLDPFTKQPKVFKAKPETRKVTARPLKALKDTLK